MSTPTPAAPVAKHHWFTGIWDFFKKLAHSNTWERSVSTTLNLIAPLTEEIVTLTAGEAAATEVQSIVTQVQNDLALVSGVVSGAESGAAANPTALGTAQSALQSVSSNLSGLLAAGHIKDPATLTKVTSTVDMIVGEIEAILKAIPTSAPASPSGT